MNISESQPTDYRIRPATEQDVGLLMKLIRELATYEHLTHELVATEEALFRMFFRSKPCPEALIAEKDGEGVGYAIFFTTFSTFLAKPGLYLEDLYVRPSHRRCGIGRQLLRTVVSIASERGSGRLEWAVLDWNESGIKFYESFGAEMQSSYRIMRMTRDKFAIGL